MVHISSKYVATVTKGVVVNHRNSEVTKGHYLSVNDVLLMVCV